MPNGHRSRRPSEAARLPIDVSLALLKLRQFGKHHLPPGAVGDCRPIWKVPNVCCGLARLARP